MVLLASVHFFLIMCCCVRCISSAILSHQFVKDQEFAERKFVHPHILSGLIQYSNSIGFRKSISRIQALSEEDVCDLQSHDALDLCRRTIVSLNRSTPKFSTYTISGSEPERCSTYALNFHWLHSEDDTSSILALKCPSTPSIWISQGNEKNEIFVLIQDFSSDNSGNSISPRLRLLDYLYFVE